MGDRGPMGGMLTATLVLCTAARAIAVAPHLVSVLPTGGQRGTQIEVSF